jgi:hypothetical protein
MVITMKVVNVMGALAAHGDRHATCQSRRAESESEYLVLVEWADWCWRGRGRYRGGELLMIGDSIATPTGVAPMSSLSPYPRYQGSFGFAPCLLKAGSWKRGTGEDIACSTIRWGVSHSI